MRNMKDSGIEWIGEIPEDWKVAKISSVYKERNEKVSDKDFRALSVTKKGVVPQLENVAKTDNGDNRKLVRNGDFAINSRSDRRGSCGISSYDGSVSLICTVLKPYSNIVNKYYNYVFKSELFADEFYKWGHGIVNDLWSTKWNDMKRIYIPFPSENNQELIADHLDNKVKEIDNIISKTKETIEEYQKYKQSVITEAVTKGLNPNVEMKDSGIEWIGYIPKRYKIIKYKYILSIYSGVNLNNSILKGDLEYKVYGGGKSIGNYSEYNVDEENILIGRVGANCGCITYLNNKAWATDNALIIKLKNIEEKRYIYYLLIASNLNDLNTSNAQPLITGTKVLNFKVPYVDNIKEQKKIIKYLDEKCLEIDSLINKKEQLITELEEYKKSLIYECVTGKKEVSPAYAD